ncbi:hypothetical protein ACFZCP_10695 [Streptomyces sp. NPDC007971]|uniref:hypothetical protein n=1 Tax=Streptomyces sp. NPDC007971 TaxID=3364799 RepID=UPI0036E10D88
MRATRSRIITIATILLVIAGLAGGLTAVLRATRGGGAAPADPRPGHGVQQVDLAQEVADYTRRFGPDHGYRQPGRADRTAVAKAVGLLLDGHRTEAERLLSERDFTVRTVVDRVSGHRYTEVADRTDDAVAPRGWGRVYLDLDHRPRWSVQVPHPVADLGTEQLGVRVLRDSPGGILVIAGAHRKAGIGNAADVAHRRDTVFHAVCAELVRRGMPGVQLHGFAAASVPGYDVVASTGAGSTGHADGRRLAGALGARGFPVCRAWVRDCPLEGHENMQGRAADAAHVPFLHVEFAPEVRAGGSAAERAAASVTEVTRRWATAPVTP